MFIIRLRIFVCGLEVYRLRKDVSGHRQVHRDEQLDDRPLDKHCRVEKFFARFAPGILVVHGRFRALPAHESRFCDRRVSSAHILRSSVRTRLLVQWCVVGVPHLRLVQAAVGIVSRAAGALELI